MTLRQEIIRYEAMKIARQMVKGELKRRRIMLSYIEASAITKAARELVRAVPSIRARAKRQAERLINP